MSFVNQPRQEVTAWTIAKGVLLGLWMFAITAAVVSFVGSAVLLGVVTRRAERVREVVPSATTTEPRRLTTTERQRLGFDGKKATEVECQRLYADSGGRELSISQGSFIVKCRAGDLTEKDVRP